METNRRIAMRIVALTLAALPAGARAADPSGSPRANEALSDMRGGRLQGAAVLIP